MEHSNLACIHAKRVTLMPKDIELARKIRGEIPYTGRLADMDSGLQHPDRVFGALPTGEALAKKEKEREERKKKERAAAFKKGKMYFGIPTSQMM